MRFDNSYARMPERFYTRTRAAQAPQPRLLAWNSALADELGLSELGKDPDRLARLFSGNETLPGMEPIALAYAGHQFGYFVPQLGDGRALLLGELVGRDGRRRDLQLKGSGRTTFSRGGDGKSSLGPVIREYLVSEAMHRLGVPSTRALAAVASGEQVLRERLLPGAVLTRVAASHIRVGTFEYFAVRRDVDALRALLDHAIARHYPQAAQAAEPALAFLAEVVEAQAVLVAHWMSLGFIHGVMNTDNCAISGETIDYGPCAFMDEFDRDKVFSSIDREGRYAFGRQPSMALWNLGRLAECLLRLGGEKSDYENVLMAFEGSFQTHYRNHMRSKLGLLTQCDEDADLIGQWLQLLQDGGLDYTLALRDLAQRVQADDDSCFGEFENRWRARLAAQPQTPQQVAAHMDAVNPLVIPRNHQVERVIEAAIVGDLAPFEQMQRALAEPFAVQPGLEAYAEPPEEDERVLRTFCGT